jgi:hypothetical protein
MDRLPVECEGEFLISAGTAPARCRLQAIAPLQEGLNMATAQTASGDLSKRETFGLIGSDKVEGTEVYRSNGDRVGTIERVMIDKRNGNVAYAVMSFGGFLGIGDDYYPVPWSLLTYNEQLGGYEVNISDAQLKSAPKFRKDESWEYNDRGSEGALYSYYGATPYW